MAINDFLSVICVSPHVNDYYDHRFNIYTPIMKHFFLLTILFGFTADLAAQPLSSTAAAKTGKPPLDTGVLGKWPFVENPVISDDGNYVAYTISQQPVENRTLVIKAVNSSWKMEYVGVDMFDNYFFSGNNKLAIFKGNDTLHFLDLSAGKNRYVTQVSSYKRPVPGRGEWVAYQLTDPSGELVLLNLNTGKEQRFPSVTDYLFDETGRVLLLKIGIQSDTISKTTALQWINLGEDKPATIWSAATSPSPDGCSIDNYMLDNTGQQLVFMLEERNGLHAANTIWYYKRGMEKAVRKVDRQSPGVEDGLSIAGPLQFSRNGSWIFFRLQAPADDRKADGVKVDVWGYKDLVLQPEQIYRMEGGPENFAAVVNAADSQVVRLEQKGEQMLTLPEDVTGNFTVVTGPKDVPYWWQFSPQPSFFLVSLKDASRRLLKKEAGISALGNFSFSPHGEYLVYWDAPQTSYFSYDISAGKAYNITQSLPSKVNQDERYIVDALFLPPVAPVAGWREQDSSLLIYDNYDIWELDPTGARAPVNVTGGYGRAHHIKLRLVNGPGGIQDKTSMVFKRGEPLLLTAFDTANKYNGFYRKVLDQKAPPELLSMGPYTFYLTDSQKPHFASLGDGMRPLKAGNADCWIVSRSSATEAPNLFFTKDFKTYSALSDLRPQQHYNWLTAELVTWKQLDGALCEGILYKPEDFDPGKKYPVIFNYYRQMSHRLHQFPYPHFTGENINIPWFVSNGYLVFTPDIYYSVLTKKNKELTGESAYKSIVSAARYLSKLPFVDAGKMAVQGHSFGGLQTNYVIMRTSMFAAAAEFAGTSDPVSSFLTLAPFLSSIEHWDKLSKTETTCGATPWERPDLYSKASAVLNADKINTPLLITHNIKDNQIPWRQGVEMYMALRRLGKKAWLLQYDEESHILLGKRNAADYTIRLTQFFDHYLKDALPPKWMTEGVPARLKGIESKYELDNTGTKP
jgi:dipeptidyl aminopeptidase/acylaminoacyl peptidase